MEWDGEAEEKIKRVPFFVRKMARRNVEDYVREGGRGVVTVEDVEKARTAFLRTADAQAKKIYDTNVVPIARDRAPAEKVVLHKVEVCRGKALRCPFALVDLAPMRDRIETWMESVSFTERCRAKIQGPVLPHHRFKIALSACPNGCSQPQIKDFGVIAKLRPERTDVPCSQCQRCVEVCLERAVLLHNGGPMIHREACVECGLCAMYCPTGTLQPGSVGYTVLIGGKLGRHPQFGVEMVSMADEDQVLRALKVCVELFLHPREGERRFGDMVNRVGLESIRRRLDPKSSRFVQMWHPVRRKRTGLNP